MFVQPRPRKSALPPPPKRRKTVATIEEINFDFGAREDYLTGFHKRKVQRSKQAQEEALKKAKEERIIRDERRQELQEHVAAVNALLEKPKVANSSDAEASDEDDWSGIKDEADPASIDHEQEYIDEDKYTMVTVEAVDVSKDGMHTTRDNDDGTDGEVEEGSGTANLIGDPNKAKDVVEKETKKKVWPKKERKKKFRYESKAERKITRGKQKAGNAVQAQSRRK